MASAKTAYTFCELTSQKELTMTKFLFVTDLDHTFVGDDQALLLLSDRLQSHRQQYGTKIVYSTGRSPVLYRELQLDTLVLPVNYLKFDF
jgi:hypothetical protein